jgi:biopolymer transport protein ExbB/TolQ
MIGFVLRLLPTWAWALVLAGLVATAGATGWIKGAAHVRAQWEQQRANELAASVAVERKWSDRITEVRDAHNEEMRRVAGALGDALGRLRDRAKRLPEAARPACQGATGAELSDQDATVLVLEAARADQLRADLAACQSWIEAVTDAQPGGAQR